ncbi:MAG TPA: hypothetical protein VMT58_05840 [Candidatus Binataceae bacterium]|nr:hypothetical protein [Candidatus Binataceae bacterium]
MFTRRFSNEDEYEQWLARAGTRVHVLKVKHGPARLFGGNRHAGGSVVIKYATTDRGLAPEHGRTARMLEMALIAAGLFYALTLIAGMRTAHPALVSAPGYFGDR